MIIAVLEYPDDDQAQVFFVDMSALDLTHSVVRRYFDNVMAAHNDITKIGRTTFDASISCGDDVFEHAIAPFPCQVNDSVMLYIE